ncbi:hypothetical protein PF005_g11204 [Phytophthora fragariae]|uniref:Uncharacterized protein n=1 Tax=Phytophthora fragariae TaxID=53985 RepID=A0A6A3Y122_9STRA|nr:hypothetical protein PF011_g11632 [Phytophthora fragariae]KAE9210945.1 hypothetical protein PF005_g11204 [Phytophthora fragariae]KAE9310503.1 hypothetical protein PF001_g10149 [Phytophthora fragariae]
MLKAALGFPSSLIVSARCFILPRSLSQSPRRSPRRSFSTSSTGTMDCRPRSSPIEIPASPSHYGPSFSS